MKTPKREDVDLQRIGKLLLRVKKFFAAKYSLADLVKFPDLRTRDG
jgi:hypothetical protein